MTIQDLSTPELSIISNKFLSYMQQLESGVNKLNSVKNEKVNVIGFDFEAKINLLKSKFQEAANNFNEIQLEIENRAEKLTGFNFESESISKLMFAVDKMYFESQKN